MSKKRAKSGSTSAGPAKWESAIQQAVFNDGSWSGKVYFLLENQIEDRQHIDSVASGVNAGTRRLFSVFSKESLYNEVRELGNPKTKKAKETPANFEICEPCKTHLDNNEDIPIHLLVKLLKWKCLTLKTNDLKRREAEKKAAIEREKGAAGGGKKDKKESKSAKSKGKKTPEPPSPKKESKLRKRGDEDLDSKYIDDEPDDGPNHYILIYGFHLPYLFQLLDEAGIPVEATIKVRSQHYAEEKNAVADLTEAEIEAHEELKKKKADLKKFWHDFNIVIENVPSGSNIHDLARLEHAVQSIILPEDPTDQQKKDEFYANLYEDIACLCYDLIDTKRQYQNYLANMKLLPIPPSVPQVSLASSDSEPPSHELDMRYYRDLMNTIPQESVSVELIMYCMLEQIDSTENERVPPTEMKKPLGADGVDEKVAAEIDALIGRLALDESEVVALAPEVVITQKLEQTNTEPKLLSPHDEISMRVDHLKELRGLNAKKAEYEMLRYIPFAGMNSFPRPCSKVARERAARLQELIHFCASTGLAQSEIDRALKQFVFECLDFTCTDQNGFILTTEGEGAHHSLIPWDDPYPFFKDLVRKAESEHGSRPGSTAHSPQSVVFREGAESPAPDSPKRPQTPEDRPPTPGILRTNSRASQHTHSVVHFGTDHEGIEIQPLAPSPEQEKSINQSMEEIIDGQKRNLDKWCFAEHYDSRVLLQVLRKAMYNLPYYDTYYHKRDHSLMVVLQNPQSHEKNNCNYWENNLHSGVGFRNYIEHVAESIDGWTRAEEAKYQALVLRDEVDKISEEIKSASRGASVEKKGRGRSKSPKKSGSPKRGRSSSRSQSREPPTPVGDNFVRADSLKMLKVEMDRLKAEEEEKERQKAEKRARSAQKKKDKEASAEKKRPGSKSSKSGSRKSSPAAQVKDEPVAQDEPKEPERYWPFVGYDIGQELIHSSGKQACLFPADGGLIRTERIDFILRTALVKTTVVKDGHFFTLHILDPKEETDEIEEEKAETEENTEDCNKEEKDDDSKEKTEVKEATEEKADSEENEKEDAEKDVEIEEIKDDIPKKTVSKFGSFTATLRDGLVVSYSGFGENGKPDTDDKDQVEPMPLPPVTTSNRSPTPKEGKESPRKRDRSTEKSATPEPQPEDEKPQKEPYRRPFQKLFLTSPDGLQVQLLAERDCGGAKNSDALVVKQLYPQKTSNLQDCEGARLVPAMAEASRIITKEGNVIRTLADGRVEVLFADGTVSTMTSSPIPPPRPVTPTPQPRAASCSTKTREGSDSQSKRKNRKGSEPEKEQEEEKKPEGLWLTTLPTGKRISTNMDGVTAVPSKDALICYAHDPETKEEMYSREDKVLIVHRPDATTLVEHADGTRITRFLAETEAEEEGEKIVILERIVRVECPGFASLEFNEQSGHCDIRMGNSLVHAYPDASYILDLSPDGERLSIDKEGSAAYFPKPNNDLVYQEANQELAYFMRHDHDVIVECMDNEGNLFTVTSSGDAIVQLHNDSGSLSSEEDVQSEKIHLYKQHAPRFFLIHADGSGTELLRYQDIAEYLSDAEGDPNTAVLIDGLVDFPNVTGINILRPADLGLSQRWFKQYDEPSIVPKGLRSRDLKSLPASEAKTNGVPFGTNAGQGLAVGSAPERVEHPQGPKCPRVLEHRQLVQFRPVTDEVRDMLYDCLKEYALYVKDRNEESESMQIVDPRTDEELMHAADLVLQSMPEKAADLDNIANVYEEATAIPEPSPPPTPQPKRCIADWERDRRELQEEHDNKLAMRNNEVPPYFQSDMGKSFLLSQAADMDALMRELADDPRQNQDLSSPPQPTAKPSAPVLMDSTTQAPAIEYHQQRAEPLHEDTYILQEAPFEESLSPRSRTLYRDVIGESRQKPVWVPAYLKASRSEVKPNTKFQRTEDNARRKVLTSSIAGATEKGKQLIQNSRGFELLPTRVEFGTLREGYTYQFPVYLKNTGVDSCRFKLEQPPPATGLRILHKPGPVAAGMKAVLAVEIYALAVGVEGDQGTGHVHHDLEIVTETHHLRLPISAKVLTADDYDNRDPKKKSLPRAGVKLISTQSVGSQGIIRPRKSLEPITA